MRFIADLHIHSKYSRATSREMSPESIWKWAQLKGITVIGTGDVIHPQWFRELEEKTEACGNGLYRLKDAYHTEDIPDLCRSDVFFLLSTEISCIYRKYDRTRKIHAVVFLPDLSDAARLNRVLSKIGNIQSDGRPILGLDAKELLSIVSDISSDALFVPAHVWTPHFSVFGAASGFDSLEECFDDLSHHICAIETGLSSDPPMNWRLSALDHITLISNSDAHSPAKIGREANIFDTDITYRDMIGAIRNKKGFLGTIEFFPEEGKYHYDGHRACGTCLSPAETVKHDYLCPVCGRKITIGVLHRVDKLSDREEGFKPEGAPAFFSLIPLQEIISESLNLGVTSKAVQGRYFRLLQKLGSEFKILMDIPPEDIRNEASPVISEAIDRMRSGNVSVRPGYDGEYGKISIFEKVQRKEIKGQKMLF